MNSAWFAGWINDAAGRRRIAFACWVSHTQQSGGKACGALMAPLLAKLGAMKGGRDGELPRSAAPRARPHGHRLAALRGGLGAVGRFDAIGSVFGLLTFFGALLLLGFWWLNLGGLVDEARPVVSLEKTQVSLARGETAVIGRRELLQPQRFDAAELRHVAFTRQADGKVIVRNVARERRLWLDYRNASASFSARWQLATGDRIQGGPMNLVVEEALPNRLRLQVRSGAAAPVPVSVTRTGASMEVTVAGQGLRTCEPPTPIDRVKQAVTNFITADERGEDRVLHIGGRLTCAVRMERYLGAERVPFRSFTITARGDRFFFAPVILWMRRARRSFSSVARHRSRISRASVGRWIRTVRACLAA